MIKHDVLGVSALIAGFHCRADFLHRESGKEDMQESLTMKNLPESEKPYEKCLNSGAESLSDAELLAVILRTGGKDSPALELARHILILEPGGILNLEYLSIPQLKQLDGIGDVKAIQLKCVAEISRRISMTRKKDRVCLNDPLSIVEYYKESMRHREKEHLLLSMFDNGSRLIGDSVISVGTCNASLVSPREIFLQALSHKAVYVVLLHNHPSGDPSPSEEDFRVTERIHRCGQLLDIPLMDHIIIGDNCYFSFHEQNAF